MTDAEKKLIDAAVDGVASGFGVDGVRISELTKAVMLERRAPGIEEAYKNSYAAMYSARQIHKAFYASIGRPYAGDWNEMVRAAVDLKLGFKGPLD